MTRYDARAPAGLRVVPGAATHKICAMEGSDTPHFTRFRAGIEAASAGTGVLVFGAFRLDAIRRTLTAHGQDVALQPRAFDMLELFVACRGQVLSADEILGHVWRGVAVGDNNLGVQLSALRRALAAHGGDRLIVTLPGRGYRFVGEVTEEVPAGPALPAEAQTAVPLPPARPARRWRGAAIAAVLASAAVAGAVLTWRPAAPPRKPPAIAAPEAFEPPPHSIAVLAFANLSHDAADDYLSDGLSEALIDELSRVNQLQVTARTSSFTFKGRAAMIGEIARRLNVGSVLEGSLRRQGTHLRIDAHLSDARTGFQIWSHSYDRAADDLLKLQDEIARAVAEALRVKLVDTDAEGLAQGGTTNPQAFDAYLRGVQHMAALGRENDAALLAFRTATGLDPNFALAQGSLASTLAVISQESPVDDTYRAMMAEARRAADRAVELAPRLGLTHSARAIVLRNEVTDMKAAWAEAVRAQALMPGNASVEQGYALIARTVGYNEQAIRAARHAVELDPLRPDSWWPLGRVLNCARRYDEARAAFLHAMTLMERPPEFAAADLGSMLLLQGKPRAARQTCAEATPNWAAECLILADYALGRRADAQAALAKMQAEMGDSGASTYADAYAQWGQPMLAVKWLKKEREVNDPSLWDLKCDPWLDPIRGEPGFREVEQSMHFPPPE